VVAAVRAEPADPKHREQLFRAVISAVHGAVERIGAGQLSPKLDAGYGKRADGSLFAHVGARRLKGVDGAIEIQLRVPDLVASFSPENLGALLCFQLRPKRQWGPAHDEALAMLASTFPGTALEQGSFGARALGELTLDAVAERTAEQVIFDGFARMLAALDAVLAKKRPPSRSAAEAVAALEKCALPTLALASAPAAPKLVESRFGGVPYGEAGEGWPRCGVCDAELTFQLQFDARPAFPDAAAMPALYAFYICTWECLDSVGDDEPAVWCVRCHDAPSPARGLPLTPREASLLPERALQLAPARSLPEDEDAFADFGGDLSVVADAKKPYSALRNELGALDAGSNVGGYPSLMNDDELPRCPDCKARMRLLLQLGPDGAAGREPFWEPGELRLFVCLAHPRTTALQVQPNASSYRCGVRKA